jgi:hypothetical protein
MQFDFYKPSYRAVISINNFEVTFIDYDKFRGVLVILKFQN